VYCLDPEQADIVTKKYVATVQCHEVAHQWFGNITTMEWWDNLYLVSSSGFDRVVCLLTSFNRTRVRYAWINSES
jgi:hypothetical protein